MPVIVCLERADVKTKPTSQSVGEFHAAVEDNQKRADCKKVAALMRKATGHTAKMWGTGMVGYGSYDYKYASGQEGCWFLCGFSPRAQFLTIYIMPGFKKFDALMLKLGKHKTGKSCPYIKRLAEIDLDVLDELIGESVEYMRRKYK